MTSKKLFSGHRFTYFIFLVILCLTFTAAYHFYVANRAIERSRKETYEKMFCVGTSLWVLTCCTGIKPSPAAVSSDGKKLSSWRFVEYICDGSREPAQYLSKDWTSNVNSEFVNLEPTCFCFDNSEFTCIFVIVGESTAFDSAVVPTWDEVPTDTIIMIEAHGRDVHWMEPVEINIASIPNALHDGTIASWLGASSEGVVIGFADGEVWQITDQTPLSILTQFFDVTKTATLDREKVLRPFACKIQPAMHRVKNKDKLPGAK